MPRTLPLPPQTASTILLHGTFGTSPTPPCAPESSMYAGGQATLRPSFAHPVNSWRPLMKTMRTDPIIDELRAVRDEHAARCGYDIEAIFRDIRARENASGRDYISRPARRAQGRETPTAGMDDEATFGHYMIGVFDVLGQSRKLQEQAIMPLADDPAERQRVVANLKDTAGVVIGFRGLFRKFFEGAAQSTGRAYSLPEPQRSEMLAAMASNVLLWGVSDAIFVAVPLTWERHPAARAVDVFRSLLAASSMWLVGLSTNHPIRGGMEIGTGIDLARLRLRPTRHVGLGVC